jgi:hypothetical protein
MLATNKKHAISPILWASSNKKVMVMCIFLLLSAVIWIVNKLSYSYQSSVEVSVLLTISDEGKIIAQPSEHSLQCLVRARGYDIALTKIMAAPIVKIDAAAFDTMPQRTTGERILPINIVEPYIREYLGKELELIDILADSIRYCIDVLSSKKAAVRPNITISPAAQHVLIGKMKYQPDSVVIYGAHDAIENVEAVPTAAAALFNVKHSMSAKLPLLTDSRYTMSHKEIAYSVEALRFAEIKMKIPIVCQNIPAGMKVDFFPSTKIVSLYVGMQGGHVPLQPKLAVDYLEIADSKSGLAAARIANVPDGVLRANVANPIVRFVIKHEGE